MDRIACMGDNCVDYYDETGDVFYGGNSVNVAVSLRRLGVNASCLSAVGTDRFGEEMRSALAGRGVDVSRLRTLSGPTALTHVKIREGERVFGDYEEGVMAGYALTEEDFSFISGHRIAVTGLWGRCEHALERIRAMGVATAFDCSDRPEDPAAQAAIPHAEIVFFSDDVSGDEELGARMREIFLRGTGAGRTVVATRGGRGSLLYDGTRFVRHGIIPCEVKDTMGAGDSYIAGFLAGRLRGAAAEECMEAGARSAAVTLGYAGPW